MFQRSGSQVFKKGAPPGCDPSKRLGEELSLKEIEEEFATAGFLRSCFFIHILT